jgi:hypothetical protein
MRHFCKLESKPDPQANNRFQAQNVETVETKLAVIMKGRHRHLPEKK